MPNPIFSCPKCGQLLSDIPAAGVLTAVCAHCRLKFQVVRGRVRDAEMRQITEATRRIGAGLTYTESHEIRLELPIGRTEVVPFELSHEPGPVPARAGDVFSAVYLMRGSSRERLLSVHNATTGLRIELSSAGGFEPKRAVLLGAFAWMAVGVMAGSATRSPAMALLAATAAFVVVASGLGYRRVPRVRIGADESARLTATQRLLAEKLNLETTRAAVVRELESRAALRERLSGLRAKMLSVGLEVYAPRIASLDRALSTIDQQIALEARLRDGYERSIQMLEIELEAGAAAEALDAAAAPHIAAVLAEMRDLEEQQAELGRQLTANAEVEKLLRGDTG